jgi:hypothetical protein
MDCGAGSTPTSQERDLGHPVQELVFVSLEDGLEVEESEEGVDDGVVLPAESLVFVVSFESAGFDSEGASDEDSEDLGA